MALITEIYSLNAPTLVTSGSQKITTKMRYSFSTETAFDGETILCAIHSF